jgi:ribosome maturation factor RimP
MASIVERVTPLCQRVADELGYFIWDVDYVKEGTEWFLRIEIDKDEGIDIEDCERYSRAIDPLLDEESYIEGAYRLEVSSPGIERVIKNDFHLSKCTGEVVEIKLFAAIEGCKVARGTLFSFDNESVVLKDESEIIIPRKNIAKMHIYFEF